MCSSLRGLDEFWTRSLGGALQLFGVALVAIDLHMAMAKYRGHKNIFELIARWWDQFIDRFRRREPLEAVIGSASGLLGNLTMQARGVVERDPSDMTVEEQLAELFRRYQQTKTELRATNADLRKLRETHHTDVERVTGQLRDVDQRLVRTAMYIEAGNGRRRLAGVLCVFFGIVLATWSAELGDGALLVGLAWAVSMLLTLPVPELGEAPS
jgi:hypothetical protein